MPTILSCTSKPMGVTALQDLMMPGLSGFDVLQALQKKFQLGELPVVMVSARSSGEQSALHVSLRPMQRLFAPTLTDC